MYQSKSLAKHLTGLNLQAVISQQNSQYIIYNLRFHQEADFSREKKSCLKYTAKKDGIRKKPDSSYRRFQAWCSVVVRVFASWNGVSFFPYFSYHIITRPVRRIRCSLQVRSDLEPFAGQECCYGPWPPSLDVSSITVLELFPDCARGILWGVQWVRL